MSVTHLNGAMPDAWQRSELRFKALIENSHDGIALLDSAGRLKFISPSVERMLGYSGKELIGTDPADFTHPEDLEDLMPLLNSLFSRFGATEQAVYRMRNKAGDWCWVRSNITNKLHEPSIAAIVFNYEDITGRKQTEEEVERTLHQLRQASERQSSILNSLSAHIALLDENGFIIKVNEAWKKFAVENGLSSKNYCIGDNYIEVSDNASGADEVAGKAIAQGIRDVIAGKRKSFSLEYSCHSPSERRWFKVTITPLYKNSGGAVVSHTNITARQLAQQQIEFDHRNTDALINSTNDMVWSISNDMRLITANRAFLSRIKEMTGIWIKPGDGALYFENLSKEILQKWKVWYGRALSGEAFMEEFYSDIPFENWSEISFNPIVENGQVKGAACFLRDITQRRKAEQLLRQREKMMAEAESVAHFGSWELDLSNLQNIHQNPLCWSDEVFRIFGYEPGGCEVSNENFFKAVHPGDWELVSLAVAKALENNSSYSIDHRIVKPDNTIRWVHEEAKIILNERTGKPAKMVGTVLDITERKFSEEALERKTGELKERVKELNCLNRISAILNKSYCPVEETIQECVNIVPAAFQYPELACARITIIGETFVSNNFSISNITQQAALFVQEKCLGSLEVFYREEINKITDEPFLQEEQSLLDSIVAGIAVYIERQGAKALLHKSEAHLRTIFDNTDKAYLLLDTNYNLILYNGVASKWAKMAFGKALKEGRSLFSLISKERRKEARQALLLVREGKVIEEETSYRLQDGSLAWYTVRQYPVRNEKNEVITIIISAKDITERKKHELEKEKMTTEIIQRNKNLEQFAYIVSHNLRAPVANIIGFSELLQHSELDKDELNLVMHGLSASVNKLDGVILDLNEILQVKREISEMKETVSFSEIANDISLSIAHLLEKEKAEINCDFNQVDEMKTVKTYLYSIFYNLISNSIKYRQPDLPPVIHISSRNSEESIELVFKDNGMGIDLSKKGEQVFGLYKRFHLTAAEGKGMGLYMVKMQVEALGGKISIESEENKGTQFILSFRTAI